MKPTIFTYNELRIATEDFKPHMKLGKGAYGTVYKVCHGSLSLAEKKKKRKDNARAISTGVNVSPLARY